jgi:hypothetical protein
MLYYTKRHIMLYRLSRGVGLNPSKRGPIENAARRYQMLAKKLEGARSGNARGKHRSFVCFRPKAVVTFLNNRRSDG